MGMQLKDIRELVQLVEESDVAEFHIEHEGTTITIKKAVAEPIFQTVAAPTQLLPAPQQIAAPVTATNQPVSTAEPEVAEVEDPSLHKIVSPMVGTFYRSSAPDADPYIQEGDTINSKSIVCIVEAMKLMNEIEAEVTGKIEKILVENGQLVEFGQPLFLVRTT